MEFAQSIWAVNVISPPVGNLKNVSNVACFSGAEVVVEAVSLYLFLVSHSH